MTSRYASLSSEQLATLVPELLLCGQLIDRSGMAWCIGEWGREEMARIAIEEWMGASPIYTRRMQRALGFEGNDVVTIFKGLLLDIGAPPQFMDFRYEVTDRWHGSFTLAHCGALMDVEPMGEDYVRSMCHDIEDPTFDATAVATNPRAQIRPVHRPPRMPADRTPHCEWTVIIDPSYPEVHPTPECIELQRSRAATIELAPIDPADEGRSAYDGPLASDFDFSSFSHSALVRMADEVVLQMQLLSMSFIGALRRRGDAAVVRTIATKQLTGIAGVAARRVSAALGLGDGRADVIRMLSLHPMLGPEPYVVARTSADSISVARSPAHEDDGWLGFLGPDSVRPLQAAVRALDPHWDVEVSGEDDAWTATVVRRDAPAPELDEVAVTSFSTGTAFVFEPRRSLPITPI